MDTISQKAKSTRATAVAASDPRIVYSTAVQSLPGVTWYGCKGAAFPTYTPAGSLTGMSEAGFGHYLVAPHHSPFSLPDSPAQACASAGVEALRQAFVHLSKELADQVYKELSETLSSALSEIDRNRLSVEIELKVLKPIAATRTPKAAGKAASSERTIGVTLPRQLHSEIKVWSNSIRQSVSETARRMFVDGLGVLTSRLDQENRTTVLSDFNDALRYYPERPTTRWMLRVNRSHFARASVVANELDWPLSQVALVCVAMMFDKEKRSGASLLRALYAADQELAFPRSVSADLKIKPVELLSVDGFVPPAQVLKSEKHLDYFRVENRPKFMLWAEALHTPEPHSFSCSKAAGLGLYEFAAQSDELLAEHLEAAKAQILKDIGELAEGVELTFNLLRVEGVVNRFWVAATGTHQTSVEPEEFL